MSEQQSAPDLRPLDEHYQIVGELRAAPPTRYFIGRRQADGSDVMIAVVDAAAGGENNALAHFASDAQLLSRETHPSIAQVIEGRWLGKDTFAVVTELPAPTLKSLSMTVPAVVPSVTQNSTP